LPYKGDFLCFLIFVLVFAAPAAVAAGVANATGSARTPAGSLLFPAAGTGVPIAATAGTGVRNAAAAKTASKASASARAVKTEGVEMIPADAAAVVTDQLNTDKHAVKGRVYPCSIEPLFIK